MKTFLIYADFILLTAIVFFIDLQTPLGTVEWVGYVLPLMFASRVLNRLKTYSLTAVFTLLILLGFYFSPEGIAPQTALINRSLGVIVLWVMATVFSLWRQTEDSLTESEQKYKELTDSLPQIVFETDIQGNLLYVNRNAFTTFGYTPEQFDQGLNALQMIAPQDRRRAELSLQKVLEGETISDNEYLLLKKNGATFPAAIHSIPIFRDGQPVGLRGVIVDITERKRIEQAVQKERDKAQKYLEVAAVMFVVIDADQKVSLINEKGCQILGYQEKDVIGKNWFDNFIPRAWRRETRRVFTRLMSEDIVDAECFENPVLTASGEERVIFWHNTLLKDETGRVVGTLSSGEDVTERKRAGQALKESEEKFRELAEESPNMIFICRDGVVVYANKRCEQVTGYHRAELYSSDFDFFTLISPDSREVVSKAYDVHRPGEEYPPYEYNLVTRTGEQIPVIISTKLIKYENGQAILGVITDLTERKRADEELSRLRMGLERSSDAIFMTEVDGTITYVNSAFERIYGFTKKEAVGQNPRILKSGLVSQEAYKQLWETLLAKKDVTEEIINKTKDGRNLNVEASANPILDERGEIIGFLAVQRDITARKQAEEALRESETKYSAVVEQATDGVIIIQDGVIKFANNALSLITGYSLSDMINSGFLTYLDPDSQELAARRYKARMSDEKVPSVYEAKVLHKNGTIRDIEISAGLIQYHGRPADLGIIRDITSRKHAEREKEVILNINTLLLGELDMPRALRGLGMELRELIPHDMLALTMIQKDKDQVSLILVQPDNGIAEDAPSDDPDRSLAAPERYFEPYHNSLTQQILYEKRNPIQKNLPETGTEFERRLLKLGMNSYVAVPLVKGGVPLGMFFLASSQPDAFKSRHEAFLRQLQPQLSLYLQHHRIIERMSDSESKYRTLFENSNDAIYILQGARFVFVNPKFEELLEYKLKEVSRSDFNFMKLVAPESVPLIQERARRVDAGEKLPPHYEFKGLSKSGKVIDFDVNVSYITYNGQPAVQGILRATLQSANNWKPGTRKCSWN